jgi:glycosyltransferase involved in cell wall biosynthesis
MSLRERIKHAVGHHPALVLASDLRWALSSCLQDLDGRTKERMIVSLKADRPARGTVLLSYMIEPFVTSNRQVSNSHTRNWESLQMAQTFLDLGYNVDVISWRNTAFRPVQEYTAVVDVRHNMQRLAPLLPAQCLKVFHLDTAHILFHNAAEAKRLLALQKRRGVTLRPRRFEWPNLGIEHADYGTILGNAFTVKTYGYTKKALFRLPIPSVFSHPWLGKKDWERCRKNFLFLSSGGLVHKGLDLTLEAFASMPDCHLTICAPVDEEADFKEAYRRELLELDNIHMLGWVDVGSPEFVQLAQSCTGILSPSCSEGASGSLVTGLHASLIPIASYESGVDLGEYGLLLKDCSVAEIRKTVQQVAAMPAVELAARSRGAWEYASDYHTRGRYAERYREVIVRMFNAPAQEVM